MRLFLASAFALVAASASAQTSVYDQMLAVPGDAHEPEWQAGAKTVLLRLADRNRSGEIDTAAEVDAVPCEAWQGMQDVVRLGVRGIYGFEASMGWAGGVLGFDEAQRVRADAAAVRCLPGVAVGETIAALPDAGSGTWKAAVGAVLVSAYDRDGTGALGAAEASAVECDVWRAVGEGKRWFWLRYGFHPMMTWSGGPLGLDESARAAAWARVEACPYIVADAEVAPVAATPAEAPRSDVSSIPSLPRSGDGAALRPTFTQRLDNQLASSDETLRSGEYVDTWVLYASAGQQITVEVASSEFDPYIILKSPSGQQFENDDWNGSRSIARIVHDDAEEGQWEILATSYRSGVTGAYSVTLSTAFPSGGLTSPTTRNGLVGTVWAEDCPGTNPSRSYLRLDADGTFAWSGEGADDTAADGGDVWEVDNGALVVRWNDSYVVSRYPLTGGGILSGTTSKSCGSDIRLLRMP